MDDKPVALSRAWRFYGLRTSDVDRRAHGGFQWPESGLVEAPDWKPEAACGYGLHALLKGEGASGLLNWGQDATWQLVGFDEYVELSGKVKFPMCEVATGSRLAVTTALKDLTGGAVHGCTATAGDYGTATAGDYGTATAGRSGTATAGVFGTATAGDYGTATAGESGTATAGDYGTVQVKWFDGSRYRFATGYVGEGGIEPGVAYKVHGGKLVQA